MCAGGLELWFERKMFSVEKWELSAIGQRNSQGAREEVQVSKPEKAGHVKLRGFRKLCPQLNSGWTRMLNLALCLPLGPCGLNWFDSAPGRWRRFSFFSVNVRWWETWPAVSSLTSASKRVWASLELEKKIEVSHLYIKHVRVLGYI